MKGDKCPKGQRDNKTANEAHVIWTGGYKFHMCLLWMQLFYGVCSHYTHAALLEDTVQKRPQRRSAAHTVAYFGAYLFFWDAPRQQCSGLNCSLNSLDADLPSENEPLKALILFPHVNCGRQTHLSFSFYFSSTHNRDNIWLCCVIKIVESKLSLLVSLLTRLEALPTGSGSVWAEKSNILHQHPNTNVIK